MMLPSILVGSQGVICTGPMEFLGKDFVEYWENLKQGKVYNIPKRVGVTMDPKFIAQMAMVYESC